METYVLAIGGHEWMKMFEADLSAQWWERDIPISPQALEEYQAARKQLIADGTIKPEDLDENPKTIKQRAKYQVREIKLLAIIHPEEYKDEVLRFFAPIDRWICYDIVKKLRAAFHPIFKAMGIDYLPERKLMKIRPHFPIKLINRYVRVIPLGQKKDMYKRDGEAL